MPPKPQAAVQEAPEIAVVIVKGPAKGRWRIKRPFGPEPVSIPAADLSEAEIAALLADPELLVTLPVAPAE